MSSGLVDLEVLVKDALALQPLPASVARLGIVLAKEDWDLQEICETIRLDQALTGRLLCAANSALSAPAVEIGSVDQAVLRLGPGKVLSLAIASSLQAQFHTALPSYGLSEGELWRHSVAAALAVEMARPRCRVRIDNEAFAAALLHDVGKLVLSRHLDPTAQEHMRRACLEQGLSNEEAEEEILQVQHAEVGALVAEGWKLPKAIATGIRYHHDPLSAPDDPGRRLCYQIALADAVSNEVNVARGEMADQGRFTPDLAERLGMTEELFGELCQAVESSLDETLALYS
jgi:putative nucleotidyltransferase with HDIG domain